MRGSPRSHSRPSARVSAIGLVSLILTLGMTVSGCVLNTPHLDQLAHSLDQEMPEAELDQQFGIKLGRISMGLTKGIARIAMDEEDAEGLSVLRGLRRVEVASYETSGPQSDVHFPEHMEESFRRRGWETLARFKDDANLGWILYRIKKESLRNLLVVNLDEDELNMIRISGRLDQTIKAAIQLARGEMDDFEREYGRDRSFDDEEPEWDSIWDDNSQDGTGSQDESGSRHKRHSETDLGLD